MIKYVYLFVLTSMYITTSTTINHDNTSRHRRFVHYHDGHLHSNMFIKLSYVTLFETSVKFGDDIYDIR